MVTYNWLNHTENNVSILTIWSLFISILVKSACTFIHEFIFKEIIFSNASKILIYAMTGLLLSLIITWTKKTKVLQNILYKINNKSINDDIFDDVIDYSKRTMMMVYLKSSKVYYLGRFLYREENGLDSWIALIDYCSMDRTIGKIIFDPDISNMKSTVLLNLKDVQRIQIIYEKDSDIWKKFSNVEENDKDQLNT